MSGAAGRLVVGLTHPAKGRSSGTEARLHGASLLVLWRVVGVLVTEDGVQEHHDYRTTNDKPGFHGILLSCWSRNCDSSLYHESAPPVKFKRMKN